MTPRRRRGRSHQDLVTRLVVAHDGVGNHVEGNNQHDQSRGTVPNRAACKTNVRNGFFPRRKAILVSCRAGQGAVFKLVDHQGLEGPLGGSVLCCVCEKEGGWGMFFLVMLSAARGRTCARNDAGAGE